MTRTAWTRLLLLAIGLLVFGILLRHFGLREVVDAVARTDPTRLAAYMLLAVLIRIGLAARWMLINRAIRVKISFARLLAARVGGDAVGSLLPTARLGGDPLRVLMVRREGVSGAKASAGVALDRLVEVTGNTLAALTYLAFYSTTRAFPHAGATALVFVVLLTMLLGIGLLLWRGRRPFSLPLQTLARRWQRVLPLVDVVRQAEGTLTRLFHDQPKTVAVALLATVTIELITVLEFHMLLSAFALPADLKTVVMVLLGGGMARAVPTPASLGALEVSGVVVVGLISGRPDLGFVVGMVLRLDDTLWTMIGLATLAMLGIPASPKLAMTPTLP